MNNDFAFVNLPWSDPDAQSLDASDYPGPQDSERYCPTRLLAAAPSSMSLPLTKNRHLPAPS